MAGEWGTCLGMCREQRACSVRSAVSANAVCTLIVCTHTFLASLYLTHASQATHGHTHSYYTLEVEDIYALDREGEAERARAYEKLHNRQLLWHGSRLTNWCGILSQGLRIAPPEVRVMAE